MKYNSSRRDDKRSAGAAPKRRVKTLLQRWPPSQAQLEALISEATVDANNECEQRMGFATMISDNLSLPFETEVLAYQLPSKA